jgi:tRNA threonylcarbamoyladenosine biosynthesis protein TsaB
MLILAVDTSSPAGSLAVLEDHRTIGTVSAWTTELYSSRMFRQLEFLLRELSMAISDFELFAVATGPGSFTGLRVGLAAVKGWAEVHNKPIATVSTLEAVAAQSHPATRHLASALDARRGQIYFALYERRKEDLEEGHLTAIGSERVGTPEEFLEALASEPSGEPPTAVTPVPALLRDLLSRGAGRVPLKIEEVSPALAPAIGRLGFLRARQGRITDSLHLDANYVRPSDAELPGRVSAAI